MAGSGKKRGEIPRPATAGRRNDRDVFCPDVGDLRREFQMLIEADISCVSDTFCSTSFCAKPILLSWHLKNIDPAGLFAGRIEGLMFLHVRVIAAILALTSLEFAAALVSAGQDPMDARCDKVLVNTPVSYRQPHAQVNKSDQKKGDTEFQPYLQLPLNQLVKRVPELKGVSPAADQRELTMILRRTGATVDEFFLNIVDLIAQEEIVQERLLSVTVDGGMPGGTIESKARVRDSYLILRKVDGSRAEVNEFRMNDKGNRMDEIGLDKGFFMTSGFALSGVHFSSAIEWDSRFLHLGDQKIRGKDAYVIAFAQ